ncbi:MAG: MarR family transcriptional regulator [Limnochordales bacterium]|nr:MarR family transcriptional regulator [Limnochordales bacterium]
MAREQDIIEGLNEMWGKLQALIAAEEKVIRYDVSPSEVHCVVMIDQLETPNVTNLAKALRMTRGGVSKLTARLLRMKAIERYQREGNRKEVLFRLTPKGEEIKRQHEEMHRRRMERDRAVFQSLSEADKECLLRCVRLYNEHLDRELAKLDLAD